VPLGQSCQAGSAVLSGGAAIATGQNGYESPAGYVSGLTKVGAASTWTVLGAPAGAATLAVRYTNYVIGEQPTCIPLSSSSRVTPPRPFPYVLPARTRGRRRRRRLICRKARTRYAWSAVREMLQCESGHLALDPPAPPRRPRPSSNRLAAGYGSFDSYTYGRRDTCPSPGNCANHQALPIGKGSAVVNATLRPVGRTAVCSTQGPMGRHASPLASDAACIGQSYSRSRRRVDRRTVDMARKRGAEST